MYRSSPVGVKYVRAVFLGRDDAAPDAVVKPRAAHSQNLCSLGDLEARRLQWLALFLEPYSGSHSPASYRSWIGLGTGCIVSWGP